MKRALDELRTDFRYGLRQMAHAPLLTVVAVVVLAFGIGANSSLFAFIDTMVKPQAPGVPDKDRVMVVSVLSTREHTTELPFDWAEFLDFRDRQQVFAEVGAYFPRRVVAGLDIIRETERAGFVSARYFAVLNPRMALGRSPIASDDRTAAQDPSIVISHRYWQSKLGGDSAAVGRRIIVNSFPLTIAGVMPAGFRLGGFLTSSPDLWIPFGSRGLIFANDSAFYEGYSRQVRLVARLRDGITPATASAAVNAMPPSRASVREEFLRDARAITRPLYAPSPREMKDIVLVSTGLAVLSTLILAIACSNVSILLLGRAVARRREIAVRLSLGATRGRLIRQLVTESAMLATLAAIAGLFVVRALNTTLRAQIVGFPYDLAMSWRSVSVSFAFAIGTGLVFGLVPAFHATRASVSDALKDGAAGSDVRRARLQRAFVVAEVAMSMALVCSAGLLIRAAQLQLNVSPGYDVSRSVLVSDLSLRAARYSTGQTDALVTAIRERISAFPGVERVAFSSDLPFTFSWAFGMIERSGRSLIRAPIALIDGAYAEAIGIPILYGRGIAATDVLGAAPVAVVSEELAAQLWPGANPVGQTLTFSRTALARIPDARIAALADPSYTVVGVAGSAAAKWQQSGRYDVMISRRQAPVATDLSLVVRLRDGAPTTVAQLANELHAIDPDLSFVGFKSTYQFDAEHPGDAKDMGLAAALAGAVALGLACVGMFAVVAFGVAQRSKEIGIRLALGATQERIVRSFFGEGMRLALIGFGIGVPISIAGMRVLEVQEESVRVLGVAPVAVIVTLLLVVAALSAWLPARRAASVNPLDALRSE